MKSYLAAFRGRSRSVLRYRAAALAGIFTQFFFGLILCMIMEAWYRSAAPGLQAPLSLRQAASYIWLGQIIFALIPWRGDPELQDLVRSGDVARDLIRPLDVFGLWLARSLAWRLASLLLRFLPILVFSLFILPAIGLGDIALQPPAGLGGLLGFLLLLAGAAPLSAAITVFISCFQFRQISAVGANAIAAALVSFFSGQLVPLPLLGGPVELLYRLLPFRYLADVPYRFWLGSLTLADLPASLAIQAAWLLAVLTASRLIIQRQLRQLAIAGG
ncbi:MAG: hypothetical protein A2087_09255 [Spirochaetes bacterium GWD1_61_31]|nr:MAG: hypothetical protein A2Y37_07515 [Spirochaetes bacterium GWB1_60_80]OHD30664.1 MAG: hypothetical protein A2004_11370 [Spirochaetes bacterium GWC1_61_12]OHD36044.1 MAG: hypothetical protein A2087_09255 [Spirochaetes bacterium GWD1_61_31]OHD42439.1 MAG: hypothetical protein A2Y35_06305 [Spirochaetes bacterium GWE1_60_18]OHD59241.1 MAG: hypothetical protein A2Y32_00485 [Spirochaetes bacterium GWF1_60_12]HAP43055.1 ABC transporter permease [Spirochaetaceae bacterium]